MRRLKTGAGLKTESLSSWPNAFSSIRLLPRHSRIRLINAAVAVRWQRPTAAAEEPTWQRRLPGEIEAGEEGKWGEAEQEPKEGWKRRGSERERGRKREAGRKNEEGTVRVSEKEVGRRNGMSV